MEIGKEKEGNEAKSVGVVALAARHEGFNLTTPHKLCTVASFLANQLASGRGGISAIPNPQSPIRNPQSRRLTINIRKFTSMVALMILLPLCLLLLSNLYGNTDSTTAAPLSMAGYRTENPGPFLSWPLPSYIGLTSVTYLPNSNWTLNLLGITHCPAYPAMLYSDGQDGRAYWPYYPSGRYPANSYVLNGSARQAKWQNWDNEIPGSGNTIACYSARGYLPDHKGTDFAARNGTQVYAAAWADQITVFNSYIGYRVRLRHPNVNGTGQTWYTFYDHLSSSSYYVGTTYPSGGIYAGQQIGNVGLSHLHFQVAISGSYDDWAARNPWGIDQYPWNGCLWINQRSCPY